jgi:hypothetical protein
MNCPYSIYAGDEQRKWYAYFHRLVLVKVGLGLGISSGFATRGGCIHNRS